MDCKQFSITSNAFIQGVIKSPNKWINRLIFFHSNVFLCRLFPYHTLSGIFFFGSFTLEFDYFPSLFLALFESRKRNERLPLQMAAGKKPAHCEINSIKSLKLLFDENEEKKETTQQVTNQPTDQSS